MIATGPHHVKQGRLTELSLLPAVMTMDGQSKPRGPKSK